MSKTCVELELCKEITRLKKINAELLDICKAVADDASHSIKGDLQAKLRKTIAEMEVN